MLKKNEKKNMTDDILKIMIKKEANGRENAGYKHIDNEIKKNTKSNMRINGWKNNVEKSSTALTIL